MGSPLRAGRGRGRAANAARPLPASGPPRERGADGKAPEPSGASSDEVPASFRALRAALLGLLLMGALLSAVVAVDERATRGMVYPGVYVMDVAVGRLGPLEAMGRVSEETGGGSLAVYRFTASAAAAARGEEEKGRGEGGRNFEYRSGDLGVDFDVRESARRAYLVGRQGGPMRRLKERLAARLSGRFPVEADISYDRDLSRSAVEEISEEVERPAADARVEIRGAEAALVPHVPGLRVDRERTLGSLSLALGTLTSEVAVSLLRPLPEILTSGAEDAHERAARALEGPVGLEASFPKALGGKVAEEVAPERVEEALVVRKVPPAADDGEASGGRLDLRADAATLEPYAADFLSRLALDPEDARLEFVSSEKAGAGGAEVVADRPGSRPAETASELAGRVADGLVRKGEHRYDVKTEEVPASVTTEELKKLKPTGLLADHAVSYDASNGAAGAYDDPARLDNLSLAAGVLDGYIVPPGKSLSLLSLTEGSALAPASPAAGAEEPDGGPDRPAVDDGDGLSQAATALYGAALLSGLPVDERAQSPTAPLPYADGGLEAFVSPGTPGGADLVVRNDREEYLLVRAEADASAGTVEVGIYGRPGRGEGAAGGGELRSVRVALEEGGADGLARETWRAQRVGGAGSAPSSPGDEDLGEHAYAYPSAESPPPPPEPVDGPEKPEEDPSEDPASSPPSLVDAAPEGMTTSEEEPRGDVGETTGPLADEGLVGPLEGTAPDREPEETAPEDGPDPGPRGGIIGDDAGGFP